MAPSLARCVVIVVSVLLRAVKTFDRRRRVPIRATPRRKWTEIRSDFDFFFFFGPKRISLVFKSWDFFFFLLEIVHRKLQQKFSSDSWKDVSKQLYKSIRLHFFLVILLPSSENTTKKRKALFWFCFFHSYCDNNFKMGNYASKLTQQYQCACYK